MSRAGPPSAEDRQGGAGTEPSVLRLLRRGMAVYTVLLVLALLYPFDFMLPLRHVDNGAAWRPGGGLTFERAGMVRSTAPPRVLYDRLAGGEGLTVELQARADNIEQAGPARIVSYSLDPWHRNVTLAQEHADLVIRLRTDRTDRNGERPQLLVRDVFVPGVMRHIVTAYDLHRQRVYVDGRLRRDAPIPGGTLEAWEPDHMLVFGNEATGGRPWLGTLREAAFYDRAIAAAAVRARHLAAGRKLAAVPHPVLEFDFTRGPLGGQEARESAGSPVRLLRPERISAGGTAILSVFLDADLNVTLRDQAYLWDVAGNVALFLPLGALLSALATGQGHRWRRTIGQAVLAAAVLSLGAELLQALLASRESSLYDVLSNTAGAGLGAAAAAAAWPRLGLATACTRDGPAPPAG